MTKSDARQLHGALFGRANAFGRRFARLARVGVDSERKVLQAHVRGRDMRAIAQRVYQGGMSGEIIVPPQTELARLFARIERLVHAHLGRNRTCAFQLVESPERTTERHPENDPSQPHHFF